MPEAVYCAEIQMSEPFGAAFRTVPGYPDLVSLGGDEVHNPVKFVVPASAGPDHLRLKAVLRTRALGGMRSLATDLPRPS